MGSIFRYLTITASFILLLFPSATPSFPTGELDAFIKDLMSCRNVRTLSISIVNDTQTLVAKGYGYGSNSSATNQPMHLIASLTKAFTATLLGQLLQEKGLTYDTPVHQILPDLRFPSDYVTEQVTVRDLLSHRTGIPRYDWLWIADAMDSSQIAKRIRFMDSEGFRKTAIYNNNMFGLAGLVAEELGGAPWEDLVTSRLLRPLGMDSTTFWKSGSRIEHFVQGQREGQDENMKTDPVMKGLLNIAPAISMVSSASDMALWMHSLLRPEYYREDIVEETLTPSTVFLDNHNMWVNEIKRPEADEPHIYDKYGLAWFLGSYRTYSTAMHYGSYVGSYSHITLMREKGLAIFTSNTGGKQNTAYNINSLIHTYVLDLLLGHKPWLTAQRACDFAFDNSTEFEGSIPEVDKTLKPEHPLDDYTGVYYHSVFGFCNITQDGSTMTLKYGILLFEMHYAGNDRFNAWPTVKDWGSWFLPLRFLFNGDSPKMVLPFQGYDVFVQVPKSANINEWVRIHDLQTSAKNNDDSCNSAVINLRPLSKIYIIILTIWLFTTVFSYDFYSLFVPYH